MIWQTFVIPRLSKQLNMYTKKVLTLGLIADVSMKLNKISLSPIPRSSS